MRTIRTKVYTFNELSENAKEKAVENYRNSSRYDDYEHEAEYLEEHFNEQLREKGFINPAVQFRLSYSQGDGLQFSADGYDNNLLIELIKKQVGEGKDKTTLLISDNTYVSVSGCRGNRYFFASESDVTVYFDDNLNYPNIEDIIEKVQEDLREIYMDACADLEQQGYESFSYIESDEYISETLSANDYEFLIDGTIYS